MRMKSHPPATATLSAGRVTAMASSTSVSFFPPISKAIWFFYVFLLSHTYSISLLLLLAVILLCLPHNSKLAGSSGKGGGAGVCVILANCRLLRGVRSDSCLCGPVVGARYSRRRE